MKKKQVSRWITRKELSVLLGCSYNSIARSESHLKITDWKVQLNPRKILYYRDEVIAQLKKLGLI